MGSRLVLRYKSARDIEKVLREWVLNGRITSKTIMGKDYREINKKYATGELLVTSVESIDTKDKYTQDVFEEMHQSLRVMTKRELMLYKGYTTQYQINQAVKKGELIKFDLLGKSAILYIA